MDDSQITTLEQVRAFLEGTDRVEISISSKADCYPWVQRTLVRFEYLTLGRPDRGVLLRYLCRLSGYSRAQMTRLVQQYRERGKIERCHCTTNGFAQKYTREDIRLLADLDELHGTPSGPAAKKLCERAHEVLSKVRIGERRKPRPNGKPGYLRVDTVHQGDLDGKKGVYYINTVDEITQFEIVGCVERINETHLVPLLESLLRQYPFGILGFHADNGSEFINGVVAKLLWPSP